MTFIQWLMKGGRYPEEGWFFPWCVQVLLGTAIGTSLVVIPLLIWLRRKP